MCIATRRPSTSRIILRKVSWETYERLLKDLENRSSPRLTYDRGVLEIMSPHFEHDRAKEILGYIAVAALEETDVDFESAASTTYKREDLERGFAGRVVLHSKRPTGASEKASRYDSRSSARSRARN